MAKRHPGVRVRGNSIQIDFTHDGCRYRKTLKISPTRKNIEYAKMQRDAILFDIARGQFDLSKYFSSPTYDPRNDITMLSIGILLKDMLKHEYKDVAKSTIRDYVSSINYHLIPSFGHYRISELKSSDVLDWARELPVSNKRKNNILIPLRKLFYIHYSAGRIVENPMDRVKNFPLKTKPLDPFNLDEINKILDSADIPTRALFQFAFWTGLRSSELLAIQWGDIDLDVRSAYIHRAIVRGVHKEPKTKSGIRRIQLISPAVEALRLIPDTVSDHMRVFCNPSTKQPWSSSDQIRKTAWIPLLKKSGVRYRCPYQTRHTFASQMLSAGADPTWLANQMGHKDWGMIRQVYARWMPDSRPDMIKQIESRLSQASHSEL